MTDRNPITGKISNYPNPLPDSCRLGNDRMRIIKAATSHANAVNSGS